MGFFSESRTIGTNWFHKIDLHLIGLFQSSLCKYVKEVVGVDLDWVSIFYIT